MLEIEFEEEQGIAFMGNLLHAGPEAAMDEHGNVIPAPRLHQYIVPATFKREKVIAKEGEEAGLSTWPLQNLIKGVDCNTFAMKVVSELDF
jgi:hypothetical protein